MLKKYRALPGFLHNWRDYRRANHDRNFDITFRHLWFRTFDRYDTAGTARGHYFFQDLWAAQKLHDAGVDWHVDVGSRIDGFIAHVLPFCRLTYVDLRPDSLRWPNFEFRRDPYWLESLVTAIERLGH